MNKRQFFAWIFVAPFLVALITLQGKAIVLGALGGKAFGVAIFAFLMALFNILHIPLPSGGFLTISSVIIYLSTLALGPSGALFSVPLGTLVADLFRKVPSKALRTAFNASAFGLTAYLGLVIFLALGGEVGQPLTTNLLLPYAAMVLVRDSTNYILTSSIVSIYQGRSFFLTLKSYLRGTIGNQFVSALIGLFIYSVYLNLGTFAVLFISAFLLIARYSFKIHQEAKHFYLQVVRMLTTVMEARDPYTSGHSTRVADLALLIGQELKLNPDAIETLHNAALLHDIGKMGIKESILLKPGPLSATERQTMNDHPVTGYYILQRAPALHEIAKVIYHHHERYDGTGYPDGLKGEKIPLLSRIITIADAFDAMTSDRPYRPAMTKAEALEQMGRVKGKHFDPELLEIFAKCLEHHDPPRGSVVIDEASKEAAAATR